MKVQEVILRAVAKKITCYQAAEIIGISDRHRRRWRERYQEFGYDGLFDRRRGKPSPKRVPLALVAHSVEYFKISRDVLTTCAGKSTYARCGIIVNRHTV